MTTPGVREKLQKKKARQTYYYNRGTRKLSPLRKGDAGVMLPPQARKWMKAQDAISFPESTSPLSSGTGNKRLWDKAFSDNRILVIPVVFQDGLLAESAYSSTFHKAIEFSLKKLGKLKLELRRKQYDAIRAICFERKDALAVLPTGFRKSLIYREFLTTFEAVSLNVIILLCLLCHPEAGL